MSNIAYMDFPREARDAPRAGFARPLRALHLARYVSI